MTTPHIYLIAGEASGDMLGAGLMKALKEKDPAVSFAGIGGEEMQAQGLQSLFSYRELSIMGFWEIVPHIPKLLRRLRETLTDIKQKKPDTIITIDSPGFTFRLANMLKNDPATKTVKRIHYVAPSVWAYKPKRAIKTTALFDCLLTLLPFEPPYFQKYGLNTIFVGHPVLWQTQPVDKNGFLKRYALAENTPLLLLLPGSRKSEVERHLPIFIESAKAFPEFKIAILASPQVKSLISQLAPASLIIDIADKWNVFTATTMALSKSGTITLELAVANVPAIVAHKVSALSAWLIKQMMLIPYVSLVNIVAKQPIIPELLQEQCNPIAIISALKRLNHPQQIAAQQTGYKQALAILRGNAAINPSQLAADAILNLLRK